MKLIIENTPKIVEVNGSQMRIWQGHTESGIPVHCYVARVAVHKDADHTQFERELAVMAAPREDVQAIPLRLLID